MLALYPSSRGKLLDLSTFVFWLRCGSVEHVTAGNCSNVRSRITPNTAGTCSRVAAVKQ